MNTNQITYHNTSTRQLILPVNTEILINKNDPVFTFNEILEGMNLNKYFINNHLGRNGYNNISLLKIILFAFMINVRSTRAIKNLCANDIRFMWLSDNIRPTHTVIADFIKKKLTYSIDDIFTDITKRLIELDNINTDFLFIDGTKIEANANKYTFVWKKAVLKFQAKLYIKISTTINLLNKVLPQYNINNNFGISDTYQSDYILTIINEIESIIDKYGLELVYGKGNHKLKLQKYYDNLLEYYEKLQEYDKKLEICGNDRNSYSKTDNDATFMRMKEDYMKNGQLKAGYNIQIGVSDEYILNAEVYQDRADVKTFAPFLNDYQLKYGFMPKYPVADAGYGSYDNYLFCKENNLELFQKYIMYSREKEKAFKKQRYNSRNFNYEENGKIRCNEGKEFIYQYSHINEKGSYPKIIDNYQCNDCHECSYQKECTKAKDGYRKLQVCQKQRELEALVKSNLDSPLGIELRVQRSIQVEGAFGVIKEDMKYRRISRKGIENVKTEIKLLCLGYNLMKYHNKKYRKNKIVN
ncbi:transposase [Bacilli bacterium PM5-3]|nr:transposase [Bacilli bacterium PM5-3]